MLPVEQLFSSYSNVQITTSSKEQFEITPSGDGYIIRDTTPPANEMTASVIHSIKAVKGNIATARPEEIMFFDGIAKGFHFAWRKAGSNDLMTSKGKIESCTTDLELGNLQFRLQLLEAPGRKFEWSGLDKSFSVNTATAEYIFKFEGEQFTFEGRRLINILSLYKSKRIALPELFTHQSEYDAVTGRLFYNHPFIVFTEENGSLKMAFANEPVSACSVLG
ncbi:hypothetical protein [Paenibacillus rubinfantis]|uniref:hypothetical protein n=1 Tax=Paenibacillus rubinfantis TaxID=1720296 RepID=UPI00073F58B9|nr:hypothetical protein [Paenibacillus rubinfantis]